MCYIPSIRNSVTHIWDLVERGVQAKIIVWIWSQKKLKTFYRSFTGGGMSLEIEGGSSRLPPHLVHHTVTLHNCTHINTIYSYNLMQFRINSDTILHLGTIFKIINECHTHLDTISSPCEKEITTHHINLPKWYRIVFCLCVHTHTQWLSQAIPPKIANSIRISAL